MNRIIIDVEFRQKTIAGLADCKAYKMISADEMRVDGVIKNAVQYVKKILDSDAVRDASITFSYGDGVDMDAVYRINQEYNGYQVIKWERWNSRDFYDYDKITAKQIREMYLACAERIDKKEGRCA